LRLEVIIYFCITGSRPESSEGDHPHYQNGGNPPLLLDPMAINMMPPELDKPISSKRSGSLLSNGLEKVANGLQRLHLTSNGSSNFGPKGSLV
jgi:hypothetical protein